MGITDNQLVRAATHFRTKGIITKPVRGLGSLTRAEARAVEQVPIEHFGLGRNGGTLQNQINSIASSNPVYRSSIRLGTDILHNLKLFGF